VTGKTVTGKTVPAKTTAPAKPAAPAKAPARSTVADRPAAKARVTPPRYRAAAPTAPAEFTAVKVYPSKATAPQDRRGRVDVMPLVPGPDVALDAAAPPPRAGRAAPGRYEEPEAETSWASRSSATEDDYAEEDVSLRALFRRRRS